MYNQPSHEMKCNSMLIILYSLSSKRPKELYKISISWKPLRFASWFPTLISCSPNLPRVYIRLCKHGNHFTFLQYKIISERFRRRIYVLESTKSTAVLSKWESANIDFICFASKGVNHRHRKSRLGIPHDSPRFVFQFDQAAVYQFLR